MLSAVILIDNKEKKGKETIESVDFCDEIVVIVDKGGIKGLEKGRKGKIKLFERDLRNNFASQRNYGMEKARGEWLLFIDSDEVLTEALQSEIKKTIKKDDEKDVYYIKRRDVFWGKDLMWGEVKKAGAKGLIRLMKKNSGKWKGKIHEVFVPSEKKIKTIGLLEGYIVHKPHKNITSFLEKINRYSSIRAEELKEKGEKTNILQIILFPFGKFVYTYFILLGILDGPAGFVYSFMMSFHSFLVRAKLYTKVS